MDLNKSSFLAQKEAEEKSSLNTGDPAKLVDFGERGTGPNLHESKMELINAQNSIIRMISDDINGAGVLNHEYLETLSTINTALMHGVNYLEHLDATLKSIRYSLFVDVDK